MQKDEAVPNWQTSPQTRRRGYLLSMVRLPKEDLITMFSICYAITHNYAVTHVYTRHDLGMGTLLGPGLGDRTRAATDLVITYLANSHRDALN
jgi:hypothetical protein